MIRTITDLTALKVNSGDFIEREDVKIIVIKDDYEIVFKIAESNTSYARRVSVPNSLIDIIAHDNYYFKTVSNRTCTILYYMAGYNPRITARQLITLDSIIGGLLYD